MEKLFALCVLSLFFIVPGSMVQSATAAENPRHVEITAHQFGFDPGVVTLKKGQPVVLELKSTDVPHGIRFRDLGIELKVPKGGTGHVQFTPDKVGDFVGHCYVFCGAGHGTMTLTLHVVG
jgi:cytochrome c oxidase subunit 2